MFIVYFSNALLPLHDECFSHHRCFALLCASVHFRQFLFFFSSSFSSCFHYDLVSYVLGMNQSIQSAGFRKNSVNKLSWQVWRNRANRETFFNNTKLVHCLIAFDVSTSAYRVLAVSRDSSKPTIRAEPQK